jgi:hypothetical protein
MIGAETAAIVVPDDRRGERPSSRRGRYDKDFSETVLRKPEALSLAKG